MGRCDAIYTPIINKWNGMRSVQLRVCDMRPAPIEDPEAFMKDRGDKFIDAFSENILYNTGCGIDTGEKKARGLEKLLTDSIAGTMVLCFTEGGAVDLMKELADKGLFRRLDMVSPQPNIPLWLSYGCFRPGDRLAGYVPLQQHFDV